MNQFNRLPNSEIVFYFPWSTIISISGKIDVTVDSRSESWTMFGMGNITILCLLPYYSRASRKVSTVFNFFQHLWRRFSLFSWSRFITASFKLIISSLALFTFFITLPSRFWKDSLFTAESFFALVMYSCFIIIHTAQYQPTICKFYWLVNHISVNNQSIITN